jgi:hypothetical protein
MGLLQTLLGPGQVTAFNVHDAQIVVALDVHRVQIQDADVALGSKDKKLTNESATRKCVEATSSAAFKSFRLLM